MKKIIILFFIVFACLKTFSQGCVAVRQMGGVCNISNPTQHYNLAKGDFQVGLNYRYFHSWRHFVGTEEQPQRQYTRGGFGKDGIERGNAVNIYSHAVDFNFSYGLTDRIQLNATLPWVHNERSQVMAQKTPTVDTFRYSVFAKGLADIRLGINYWTIDPAKTTNGNLMIGLGVKLKTGDFSTMDKAPQTDGTVKNVVMDQAIQPGDGGIGFSVELQGFTKLYKGITGFANAYYLFSPQQSNGVYKSAPSATPGLAGYELYASPDQYFLRAGAMTSIGKAKRLTASLALRMEGIPAYDVLGGQVAYRRPGYVVAIESGISYATGQHNISLFIPYNFIKNRIQSAADIATQNIRNSGVIDPAKLVHVQGDAAFADYSISLGYTYRFVKKGSKHAM